MSDCLPIPVIRRIGGSGGYDRKDSAVSGAFDLEPGFVVGVILPFERNVTVPFDLCRQIGWCRWHDQRHRCDIGMGRVSS
jgi:hypothetical protein